MKTLREIQVEQAEWSQANFGEHSAVDPAIGVLEEVGEIAHAELKMRQGIRGTPAEHLAAIRDGIGDAAIYCLDVMSCVGAGFRLKDLPAAEPDLLLARLGEWASAILRESVFRRSDLCDSTQSMCAGFLGTLDQYADSFGWSIVEIVNEVWKKVKRRDWKANPETGVDDLPTHVSGVPVHLRGSAESILGSKVDWSTGRVLGASPDEDDWTNQPTANVGVSRG